jgi:transposase
MDQAYADDQTRAVAQERGFIAIVPPRCDRKQPWDYDPQLYKRRSEVERLFRRIKA